MRHLLLRSLAALACFGIFGLPQTSAVPTPDQSEKPDFSGTWALDPKASASLEPLIKKIGGSLVEQKFDSWANLKATIQQTEQVITVATRGLGFALDETLYLDGRRHPSNLQLPRTQNLELRTRKFKPTRFQPESSATELPRADFRLTKETYRS